MSSWLLLTSNVEGTQRPSSASTQGRNARGREQRGLREVSPERGRGCHHLDSKRPMTTFVAHSMSSSPGDLVLPIDTRATRSPDLSRCEYRATMGCTREKLV